MNRGLVIPDDGSPVWEIQVGSSGKGLNALQEAVAGWIEAIGVPEFIDPNGRTTCYLNEEGKYMDHCKPNMRATDFLVPGVGLRWGDYIAGNMIVIGFNPRTGENEDIAPHVEQRIRLIEREAA